MENEKSKKISDLEAALQSAEQDIDKLLADLESKDKEFEEMKVFNDTFVYIS